MWDSGMAVAALDRAPEKSLLLQQLTDGPVHYQDTFLISLFDASLSRLGSRHLLAELLEGFVQSPPVSVSYLMALRNMLVRPLGLRTSRLGCPVSSLLSPQSDNVFAGRFPVREQLADVNDTCCQVVLGANDKHLLFRSCVGVAIDGNRVDITLGIRVRCKNTFGRMYMKLIDRIHRRYIAPTLLRHAVEHLRR
ncbi:hypothetical protein GCM10007862_24930 [Dyella lipolytica]|nr:hypothetical protein GCM10007862_24930 [Dyella lipolytica]